MPWDEVSVAKSFAKKLDKKSIVKGSNVRTEYGTSGVDSDEQLLKTNKGKVVVFYGEQ